MDHKNFITLSLTILSCFITVNCQTVLSRNAVATALKDILSPSNNERAAQILRMAASRQRVPEVVLPVRTAVPKMGELNMPSRVTVQTQIVRPEPQQIQPVYQNVPVNYGAKKETVVYPSPSPVSFGTPYLPGASPVPGFLPPTMNLPPRTQSRSQHLRKIPIPPPTL